MSIFVRHKYLFSSIIILIGIIIFLFIKFDFKSEVEVKKIQQKFIEKENNLKKYIDKLEYSISKNEDFSKYNKIDDYIIHVFQNDSLIFWNSNIMPINRYVDINFPINGLSKFQNAWYYSSAQKVNDKIVVVSFLIANEYKGQNQYLLNKINKDFKVKKNVKIVLDKDNSYPIYNCKNKYQFSVKFSNVLSFSFYENILLLLALLMFFIFTYIYFTKIYKSFLALILYSLTFIIFIYSICYFFDFGNWIFLNKEFYSHSTLFPNYFVLISFCLLLGFIFHFINNNVKALNPQNKITFLLLLILTGFYVIFFNLFIFTSLTDSTYFIQIEKLLSWNIFTYSFFFCLTFLVFYSVQSIGLLVDFIDKIESNKKYIFYLTTTILLISLVIFLIIRIEVFIYFLLLIIIKVLINKYKIKNWTFSILIALNSSLIIAFVVNEQNNLRERKEKKVFSEQLASDRDLMLEFEYKKSNSLFNNFLKKKNLESLSKKDINQILDKFFTNKFWERYEIEIISFNKNTLEYNVEINKFEDIIRKHSIKSDLENNLYFIKDFTSHLSYISRKKFNNSLIFITFKSKRIPEKIGFPRLLISDNSQVLKVLEKYSIAKYFGGKLVSESGKFIYPKNAKWIFNGNLKQKNNEVVYDNYLHYIYKKNSNDILVISKENKYLYNLFSSFSFLFICFLLIFFIYSFHISYLENSGVITFSHKIQGSLILFSFLFVLIFSSISFFFIRKQFDENEYKTMLDKTFSIQKSFDEKINEISKNDSSFNYLTKLIFDWKNMLQTDINIYSNSGFLVCSTEPRIYNYGVLSELMDSKVKDKLKYSYNKSLIIQDNIGELKFKSAYIKLTANDKLKFYTQLTQFRQQEEYEKKLEEFLLSLINFLNILLILSIISAILISNWLAKPLKVIQKSLSKMQLGKYNEPIPYFSDDELGKLVISYNQKLNELAIATNELTKNERELAWREMAKQVAHEIKNPLTPMKLSLQQFQRTFDPNSPFLKDKLNELFQSLITQIDSLVKISNEFSNFAKLPKENFESFNLYTIIENCVLIYGKMENVQIDFNTVINSIMINGDKNLILHVFNNLILNAIQAQNDNEIKRIYIKLEKQHQEVIIKVKDEGCGIPNELSNDIFKVNFTTKTFGSGLGLTFVYQIIQAHKGKIYFNSELNKFTEFIIHLPILDDNF